MAAIPELVFCGGKNARTASIATEAGFRYGAQLPCRTHAPVWFADQDWKRPRRTEYMAALAEHRPCMATVLDWEREDQLGEVLQWAEQAAQYVERVVIVPKVFDIDRLPRSVGGRPVVIGYSIPTKFGASCLPLWELAGWPVHLLGGSPQRQMREWQAMRAFCDVVSADGNMSQKMMSRNAFWTAESDRRFGHWRTIEYADGAKWPYNGAPYEAFRRSCVNIRATWDWLSEE